ncbi:MAG: hypothetical protein COA43_00475 [Robiginitomaculum sp.]|nr:MAG: hypothetical protein COA43_00475 [Robiginitomaculum sp.]
MKREDMAIIDEVRFCDTLNRILTSAEKEDIGEYFAPFVSKRNLLMPMTDEQFEKYGALNIVTCGVLRMYFDKNTKPKFKRLKTWMKYKDDVLHWWYGYHDEHDERVSDDLYNPIPGCKLKLSIWSNSEYYKDEIRNLPEREYWDYFVRNRKLLLPLNTTWSMTK